MRLTLRATAVACVALLALTTGCTKKTKAAAPPPDLCALAVDPPLSAFLPGGDVRHRSEKSSLTSTAECEVEVLRGATLSIELSRHGGTGKRSASAWAKKQYKGLRHDRPWNSRCTAADIPGLGGSAFSCARPADPRRYEAAYATVVVRKGKDVLSLTLSGGERAPEAAASALTGYARQIVERL